MAIAPQAGFPVISPNPGANSITQSVTVATGAGNRVMVVRCFCEGGDADVTSITYGGTALTQLIQQNGGTWSRVEIWILKNPTVGTANVVANKSAGISANWRIVVDVLDGVDQTTTNRTPVSAGASTGTSESVTVASVTAGDYIMDGLSVDSTGHSPVEGADQTPDFVLQNFGAGSNEHRGSHQDGANGGVMSWTWTTNGNHSLCAVAFIPAAGGGQSIAIGQVSTASTATAISFTKSKSVGQVTQSNTAQALTRLKVYAPTGQVSQSNLAQSITFTKAKAVGQVSTTSTAQAITRLKTLLLGQVAQSSLAQTITVSTASAKFIPVAQVVVTSTVLSIGWTKRKGIGQVTGTNAALATGRLKQRTLGLIAGTNTAQGITAFVGNKSVPVVQVGVDGEALGIYPVESLSAAQLAAPRPRYSIEREQYRTRIYRRARR